MGVKEATNTSVEKLLSLLADSFTGRKCTASRVPCMIELNTLPFNTDRFFNGFPLRKILTPSVPSGGYETEALFDAWCWPSFQNDGDSKEDLTLNGGETLTNFVTDSSGFEESVVRLLIAMGNADGATLVYDTCSMMVHHGERSYGIIDGVVHSRFCTGLKLGSFDHVEYLNRTKRTSTRQKDFCALWVDAYNIAKFYSAPLTALYQHPANLNWKKVRERVSNFLYPIPTKRRMDHWINIIFTDSIDPVGKLYPLMVPKWMRREDFQKIFGQYMRRGTFPSMETRQFYINKLVTYFKPKKVEE